MTTAEQATSATDSAAKPAAASDADDIDDSPTLPLVVLPRASTRSSVSQPLAAAVLDLGDKECGDGPLEDVASALRRMPAEGSLEVRTTHGDVAIALLVWCRLVGHHIVEQATGCFLIVPAVAR